MDRSQVIFGDLLFLNIAHQNKNNCKPFYRYSVHFEFHCFKYQSWDSQGANKNVLPPEHPIIVIWNNTIQNGRYIGKKVYLFSSRNVLPSCASGKFGPNPP